MNGQQDEIKIQYGSQIQWIRENQTMVYIVGSAILLFAAYKISKKFKVGSWLWGLVNNININVGLVGSAATFVIGGFMVGFGATEWSEYVNYKKINPPRPVTADVIQDDLKRLGITDATTIRKTDSLADQNLASELAAHRLKEYEIKKQDYDRQAEERKTDGCKGTMLHPAIGIGICIAGIMTLIGSLILMYYYFNRK